MKHTYEDGVILTQEDIDRIIDSIPKERTDDVMNAWNEFTPFICMCWRQTLGYIISSFPEAAYEDGTYMVEKLLIGPKPISCRWNEALDAATALEELRNSNAEALIKRLNSTMKKKMHCPELYLETQDWPAVMAMHEILTEIPTNKSTDLVTEVFYWLERNMEEAA